MLDGDGVGVGIEIRQGLPLRYPTPIDKVSLNLLARLVIKLDGNVLAEIRQRDLRPQNGSQTPDFTGPELESRIESDTALGRDLSVPECKLRDR